MGQNMAAYIYPGTKLGCKFLS